MHGVNESSNSFQPTILTDIGGAGGALALAEVHLFKDSLIPDRNTLLAAFVAAEADFAGYAAGVLPAGANVLNSQGEWVRHYNVPDFVATADVPVNSIGGYWIETAGGALIGFCRFDQPIQINEVGDFVTIDFFAQGPIAGYSEVQT